MSMVWNFPTQSSGEAVTLCGFNWCVHGCHSVFALLGLDFSDGARYVGLIQHLFVEFCSLKTWLFKMPYQNWSGKLRTSHKFRFS
jgi:hypothetical protein